MDSLTVFLQCIGGFSAAVCTALWFFIWAMCLKRHNGISGRICDVEIKQMKDQIHMLADIKKLGMILHTQQRRIDDLESRLTGEPILNVPVSKELLEIMTRVNDY